MYVHQIAIGGEIAPHSVLCGGSGEGQQIMVILDIQCEAGDTSILCQGDGDGDFSAGHALCVSNQENHVRISRGRLRDLEGLCSGSRVVALSGYGHGGCAHVGVIGPAQGVVRAVGQGSSVHLYRGRLGDGAAGIGLVR